MDEEDKGSTDAVNEAGDAFVAAELKKAAKAASKNPETELDRALVRAQKLVDEEKKLKKEVKALRSQLDKDTKTTIESLDDGQCRRLLEAKWIDPLCDGLSRIPAAAADAFVAKIKALNEKYATTYAEVCDQITNAETELSNMLDKLTGNEFDMAGINELIKLLGGE